MTDGFFDAMRMAGEYPPKGWGFKDAERQRELLLKHFAKPTATIDPWMIEEAERLGIIDKVPTLDEPI